MPRKKSRKFELTKVIKAIARERMGRVPAARTLEPKALRKKPKYKKRAEEEQA